MNVYSWNRNSGIFYIFSVNTLLFGTFLDTDEKESIVSGQLEPSLFYIMDGDDNGLLSHNPIQIRILLQDL